MIDPLSPKAMKFTPQEIKIAAIVQPVIEDHGFALHCVKIVNDFGTAVQIMAEDPETGLLGVEDCKKLSKAISAVMDVEDPVSGNYRLELSSPGIDRYLIKIKDFVKYLGHDAKISCDMPITENGQKKFRGILEKVDGEVITINTDQGVADIPYSEITKAKLILTDELIAFSRAATIDQENS